MMVQDHTLPSVVVVLNLLPGNMFFLSRTILVHLYCFEAVIWIEKDDVHSIGSPVSYTHLDVYKRQNTDLTGPSEEGIIPACRAMIAPIELTTGQSAYFVGKPNPLMMRTGLRILDVHSEEAVIVGCLLYTSRCV